MKNSWDWIDCVFSIYIFLNSKEPSSLPVVLEALTSKSSHAVLLSCKVSISNWLSLTGIISSWTRGLALKSSLELSKSTHSGSLGSLLFCGDPKLLKSVSESYKSMRLAELDDLFSGVLAKSGWNIFVLGVPDNSTQGPTRALEVYLWYGRNRQKPNSTITLDLD